MSNKTIRHKRSSVTGNIPAVGVLRPGELGINFPDKSIYTQDNGGNVIELARDVFIQAAAPASPIQGDIWVNSTNGFIQVYQNGAWEHFSLAGPEPVTGNTTSIKGFSSGAGTVGSPYTYTGLLVETGEFNILDTITITGLSPNQYVEIVDTSAAANAGRFSVSNNIVDSTGTLSFSIYHYDFSNSNAGVTRTANFVIGNSVYVRVPVTVSNTMQQINFPSSITSSFTRWTAAADTLTVTGCLQISLDNFTWGNTVAISQGQVFWLKWTGAPGSGLCIDSANGATITGTVSQSNSASKTGNLIIDKAPTAFTFTDVIGATTSTDYISNSVQATGANTYQYIRYSATTSTLLQYSINGSAWKAVPNAVSATDYAMPGDIVDIKQKSSGTAATAVSSTVFIGNTSDVFTITTA